MYVHTYIEFKEVNIKSNSCFKVIAFRNMTSIGHSGCCLAITAQSMHCIQCHALHCSGVFSMCMIIHSEE